MSYYCVLLLTANRLDAQLQALPKRERYTKHNHRIRGHSRSPLNNLNKKITECSCVYQAESAVKPHRAEDFADTHEAHMHISQR
jgi:hypothetical protein